jgi:histidinol-phosphatase (PHP family)
MKEDWKVSLHGGHSGEYCDHAEGTLRELLDAAVAFGYHTFGVSEHVPRFGEAYLYDKEKELGWTVEKIAEDFARYTRDLQPLVDEYADRLVVLRGFEAEVVPSDTYADIMRGFRDQKLAGGLPAFDYFVGSVHFINGHSIDSPHEEFEKAIASCGGMAELMAEYYRQVAVMVETLRPDVVAHFDLIKLNVLRHAGQPGYDAEMLEAPAIKNLAREALEAVRDCDAILDLNTAGWRKGLGEPYPAPLWVKMAHEMGIPFCFGDDSHRVAQIGAGIADARQYLRGLGIHTITVLTRDGEAGNGPVVRRVVSLG